VRLPALTPRRLAQCSLWSNSPQNYLESRLKKRQQVHLLFLQTVEGYGRTVAK